MINYFKAISREDYQHARLLFEEYAVAINIDLAFQQFDAELTQLETMYQLPQGGIILAKENQVFLGCIGIRKLDDVTAELKRMYVRPQNQGSGIGRTLLYDAIEVAKECGYKKIRLDTLNTMKAAIHLYTSAGFYEIPSYYPNPIPTVLYFEKLV